MNSNLLQAISIHLLKERNFFLILDDLRDENLKNGRNRSKILIAKRNESIAHMIGSTNIFYVMNWLKENAGTV